MSLRATAPALVDVAGLVRVAVDVVDRGAHVGVAPHGWVRADALECIDEGSGVAGDARGAVRASSSTSGSCRSTLASPRRWARSISSLYSSAARRERARRRRLLLPAAPRPRRPMPAGATGRAGGASSQSRVACAQNSWRRPGIGGRPSGSSRPCASMEQRRSGETGDVLSRVHAQVRAVALRATVTRATRPGIEHAAASRSASNHCPGRRGRRRRRADARGARPRAQSRMSRASTARASPSPCRIAGARSSRSPSMTAHEISESCVHDRRLRLSEPTAQPEVVDDAHLRVHVDRACPRRSRGRRPRPIAAGLVQRVDARCSSADAARRTGDAAVGIRVPRDHDDDPQVGLASQCAAAVHRAAWNDQRYWSSR